MWDISKMFDSEAVIDVMASLYKSEVKGKIYKLIYKLNENIKITVNTPVGKTDTEDLGQETVGQGTGDGAVISAASIADGVNGEFGEECETNEGSEEETTKDSKGNTIYKGSLHPVIFMDDINKLSVDREAAQRANDKMEQMVEKKLLDLNPIKGCYMVVGNESARRKLIKELEGNPITSCGKPMKCVSSEKFLGEVFSKNLTESVHETVKRRIGLISQSVFEIRAVVDDKRSECLGGMSLAFSLWEQASVPSLLHGAEVWTDIKQKTLKLLDKVQLKFLRVCLSVSRSCPIPMLLQQTGTLFMSNRILLKQDQRSQS